MIRAFLRVVEEGSFSATARKVDGSVSSVARLVSGLEQKLGVRLLNRTTRNHGLTEIGRQYYDHMSAVLRDINRANNLVASYRDQIKGEIKVQLRASTSRLIMSELNHFLEHNPQVTVDIKISDTWVDLINEGIDVAVWLGHLQDSSLMARQLSRTRRVLCGTPEYFERHPEPQHPDDLLDHNCITFTGSTHSKDVWRFRKDGEFFNVPVEGNVKANAASVLYDAILGGLGIALIQEWQVSMPIATGHVKVVMKDYDANPPEFDVPLYAVYPHALGLAPKTRAFIDFLVFLFKRFDRAADKIDVPKLS